ncbi:hypothetical protein H8356DRAFT_1284064 [Neocallimastix lanati (nom. inval.)]|uniref:Uncharacterized protein n=1 Tax=Neocallimastix californiae TaxID=1754190 RepID=A0A1Y1ZI53_9FUNG|nr:hypothetical protein H8356DRAFT_1284064 [Neocallimastix sp. JGI-2020a]ORY09869.1 hypothetical protein LY90DRAFT_518806 [Neocallimastix californiae]|eukprot:ORY09869.1 hypothetical protein LY90DRAFT_518806 [Neocallimastix californiae]
MKILKYESLRNHLEKEFDTSISIVKYKTKDEIRKSSIPLGLKPITISNLPFVNLEYIIDIYCKIRCETYKNDQIFKIFEFFKIYIIVIYCKIRCETNKNDQIF